MIIIVTPRKTSVEKDNGNHEDHIHYIQNKVDESRHDNIGVLVDGGSIMKWLKFPHQNRPDLLELCVKTNYEMDVFRDKDNHTLLHAAVSKSTINIDIIQKLLGVIKVDTPYNSHSALHRGIVNDYISEKNRLCLVKDFVEAGATLGARCNVMGTTALHSYCEHLVDSLSNEEDNPQFTNSNTNDLLSASSTNKTIGCLKNNTWKEVVDGLSSPHINTKDTYGVTPLYYNYQNAYKCVSETKNIRYWIISRLRGLVFLLWRSRKYQCYTQLPIQKT